MSADGIRPDDGDWRAVREKTGLSRSELAGKMGASYQTVRRWEDGDTTPSIAYKRQMREIAASLESESGGNSGEGE